ncbi:MAG TPA: SDR family NAD(P)-dependent oxidoreductase [Mycobacteriales bacterium]|nr:SDR family NAD(P)-dependent oxidoreductase [Mycobacteriales bacterium]
MTFSADSTTDDVLDGIDLTGRTALVTGSGAGLGAETVRALASAGAAVILAARDAAKNDRTIATVRETVPDARLDARALDLASLASIRAFADALPDDLVLDLLINNAGVMACPQATTADGFEMQLGTNHLGHFALTARLMPALLRADAPRIVNVSSRGHLRSDIHWDDPHFRAHEYDKWIAYGQSKTANVLFTVGLEQRFGPRGLHSYALHPGVIHTELSRHMDRGDLESLRARVPAVSTPKTVAQGAATSVWAATSPDLAGRGGLYLEDCRVAEESTGPEGGYARYARDPDAAERLWAWSEGEIGEQVPLV